MERETFNRGLIDFMAGAPTPFHAAAAAAEMLEQGGFERLHEADTWDLAPGGKYYVVRNASSVIAFTTGSGDYAESGFSMAGAHTDSPALKIKPAPDRERNGMLQLGVEVYGSPLLTTWFDRDLSIAGRVSRVREREGRCEVEDLLVDFRRPVAVIPSLAIHLDREANKKKSVNNQKDLPPVVMQSDIGNGNDFQSILRAELAARGERLEEGAGIDYELFLYDVQPPTEVGLKGEFITGARIDNLFSCYVALAGLIASSAGRPALVVLNDHEEVGSLSTSGASGTFLMSVLGRLCPEKEVFARMVDRSFMVSADNAHGVHPNFGEKYDENHSPELNGGPVIKFNASQRYATSSQTAALFRHLCGKTEVPVQEFVMRSDMPCGSTIGPLTAGGTGIKTVDVGIPMLAMHSVREMAGSLDAWYLYQVLCRHFG